MTEIENLRKKMSELTAEELADLGYSRAETAEKLAVLTSVLSDLLDGVREWAEEVVSSSEKLKNSQVTAFTVKHILSLKNMFSLKLSKLGPHEKR